MKKIHGHLELTAEKIKRKDRKLKSIYKTLNYLFA